MDLRQKVPFFINYTNGYEDTVSGSESIVLPKAKAGSLKSVKLLGATEQSGTPTPDAPVDIVSNNGAIKCSPNLCDVNADNIVVGKYISAQGVVSDSEYNFIYTKYIPVKPNTTYTLTLSTPLYYVTISEYSSAQDSGFIKRNAYSSGTTQPPFIVDECVLTTDANTNYLRFGSNMYSSVTLSLADVLAVNYMLVQGSAQPYRPYGQIYTDGTVETVNVREMAPIYYTKVGNPTIRYGVLSNCSDTDYAQTVPSSIDLSTVQELECIVKVNVGTIGLTDNKDKFVLRTTTLANRLQLFIWENSSRISAYFPNGNSFVFLDSNLQLQSNTVYWFKMLYKNNKMGLYYSMTGAKDSYVLDKDVSITETPVDASITSFTYGLNRHPEDPDWAIYLNDCSTKIDGEMFFGQQDIPGNTPATAEMLLKVGNYQDTQEVIAGSVTRKIGVKVFDGTENWIAGNATSMSIPKTDIGSGSTVMPATSTLLLCTHYPVLESDTQNDSVWIGVNSVNFRVRNTYNDTTAWKAYLAEQYASGTPVMVVFPLATPTTETVTGQSLQVVAGQNIAEITQASLAGLELEATYRRNK